MLVLFLDLDSVPCAFDFCELSLLRQDLSYSNTYCRCVHIAGAYVLQVCTYCRCVRIAGVYVLQVCTYCRCVRIAGAYILQVCTYCRCVRIAGAYVLQVCTYCTLFTFSVYRSIL